MRKFAQQIVTVGVKIRVVIWMDIVGQSCVFRMVRVISDNASLQVEMLMREVNHGVILLRFAKIVQFIGVLVLVQNSVNRL